MSIELVDAGTEVFAEGTSTDLSVVEIDFHSDLRWQNFVTTHPEASIFHHPCWLTALEKEYGGKVIGLAAVGRAGELRGVLPLMATTGLPFNWGAQVLGRRLASLPRTPVAGPLSYSREATRHLLAAAIERVGRENHLQLQIKSMDSQLTELVPELKGVPWQRTYVLDLPQRAEDLRFGNSTTRHRIRGAVRRAQKLGVEVREAENEKDFRAWFELYLETMRWHGSVPRPYRFFWALWEQLQPRGQMRILMAVRQQKHRETLLSAYLYLMCGRTIHCFLNGRRRDELKVHPNDILQWHGIHDACRQGFRHYDFGEVGEEQEGLATFKTKWGAKPVRSYRYYYPIPKALPAIAASTGSLEEFKTLLWRRVPICVTTRVGAWLYRFL